MENNDKFCVYWSDFDECYYVSPDKGDTTLDTKCFEGTEKEADEFCDKAIDKMLHAL